MQLTEALLREYVPRRLKSLGLVKCSNMEVRFSRQGLAFAGQRRPTPGAKSPPPPRRRVELLDATQLCAEQIFAVCSPKLLAGGDRLRRPADVLKWPLLRLEDQSKAWERWFALAGVAAPGRLPEPVLNRASMLIDPAIDGQGVAPARTTLAAWDLIAGRIVRPFDLSWPPAGTYWILCPKATAKVDKIVRFRDWLLGEAADDVRRLKNLPR